MTNETRSTLGALYDSLAPAQNSAGSSNGNGGGSGSAPSSRTSPLEDYYNEKRQKQAIERANEIINSDILHGGTKPVDWQQNTAQPSETSGASSSSRGRGLVGGLRDSYLDKHPNIPEISSKDLPSSNQTVYDLQQRKKELEGEKNKNARYSFVDGVLTNNNTDYDAEIADIDKRIAETKKQDDYRTVWDKIVDTVTGAVTGSAASKSDAMRTLYESGQNSRTAEYEREIAQLQKDYDRAKRDYEETLELEGEDAAQWAKNTLDDVERKLNAYKKVVDENVQQKATQATAELADELQQDSAERIERAKDGSGAVGRFAVDTGVAATQMGIDALTGMALGIGDVGSKASMALRAFGGGTQEARHGGGDLNQQLGYGGGVAAVELITEKLFDGLAGIYGKGALDKVTEGVIGKLAKTDAGRTALRVLEGGIGEGSEELISDALNPLLQTIYNGKTVGESYSEEQIADWGYDFLVGAILGAGGKTVDIATGADAKKNAELRQAEANAPEAKARAAAEAEAAAAKQAEAQAEAAVAQNFVADILARGKVNQQQAAAIMNNPEFARAFEALTGRKLSGTTNEMRTEINRAAREYAYGQSKQKRQAEEQNVDAQRTQIESAIELITGKKASSEPQSAADAQGDITTPPTPSNDAVARPETLNSAVNNDVETQNADAQKNTVPNGMESNIGAYMEEEHHGNILDGMRQHIDAENSVNADTKNTSEELATELDKSLSGTNTNTQDANANYNADNTNHSTGSNTAERVYVDENGDEYDHETGYTTRTAEEVQAERDAHISDDLYYTLRAEDRLTPDNAKEWAQWQQRREERQNAQKTPVTDETAWKDAEAEFGGANHDAIYEATQKAEEFETFLESDAFTSRLTDEQYTKVSDSVTEFKNKLAGLGDGHTSFAEFAEYYKAMKDSSILGDLYSERVNEQVQLARELAEEAYSNPIPYNVEKYRHAAVKAAQMASHYIEKASKVRAELDELNNAVKENGSKRKPTELGREVERGEKDNSLREKAAAKFIRWQIMPRQMFQMIDGFKFWENGAGYRMADTIENAAVKNQMTLVEANNFFADVVKMKGYDDFATGRTKTNVRLGGETLTMSEAVSLYKAIKTMGGPDAYRVQNIDGFALKNGDKKPYIIKAEPASISGLYSALQTAIAKNEVASAYVKAFDSMSERLGKEAKDIAKAIDGVDNELFKPGDYFPLTYARVEDGNFKWDKADSKDFGVPDFKSLKERTRKAGGYVNIAPVVEVTDGYIRRAADYIAFGELADTFGMMDYMHTFGMSTLTDTVNREMGSEYGSWMRNYVNDVQDLNQTRAKSRDNWWQKLNHNFQTAVLVGNPGTPFKQKGSMWLAMSELDPRAVAKAAVTSLNPDNQQMKAARNNPLLQFRAMGNIDSSITDALQDQNTLFGKMAAKSKILKSIQNWIPASDVREVSKIYLASCYDVQMKNPGIDVNSAKFKEMVDETFQRATMRTQSQYTMNMRDEISRGDSALLKALTMFQTQQRTNANNMFTAINEAIAAKGTEHATKANKALKNATAGFFASNVAYAAMDVLAKGLRHKLKQFRDDDDEQKFDPVKIATEMGKSFAEGVGGTVIFGDNVTNLVESIIFGEKFYENGIGAIGAIEDAASAVVNLTQNLSTDNIRKTAGGLANLAGIPLNNAYTLLNSIGMYTLDVINAMNRSKESGNVLNELLKGTSAADIAGKKKAGLYSISDDPADDALKIFDSIRKAVDKFPPDQLTYTDENGDEVSYELTKADKDQYRKDAEASYSSGMDALLATAGYGKLDTKDKKAVDKALRDYAKNAAEQGYLGSKGLDHDTGASAWMRDLSEDEVPKYLVAKQTLKGMYNGGKISDYAALDGYMDDLKNGFASLTSAQRDALSDSFPRINDIYDAAAHDIPSKKWAAVYDKYMELDKTREDGYNATDKATDLAAFIDKQGLTTDQAESLKEQFKFYSHIAAEPTRYERLIDAGYSPDKANELYYRLDNMSTDGNSNVSQAEAYARLSTMDDLTNAEKDAIWAIINSGWKTTYTKYDRYHRNDVTTNTPNTGSKNGSSSISSAEAYYRALGLLK